MKANYNFQKIAPKLRVLFFIMILLASFTQVRAVDGNLTVTTTVDPGLLCQGSSTLLVGNITTSPILNGHAILWTWVGTGGTFTKTTNAINSGGTETTSLSVVPLASGIFTLTVTSEGTYTGTATTDNVTVVPVNAATISYAGTPFCKSVATPQSVTQTGTAGGTYTSTSGLTLNTSNGEITPSSSTAGTYTVSYVIAAGTCPGATFTTSVTITATPTGGTMSYTTPVCSSAGSAAITHTGKTAGGTYSITPTISGVNVDANGLVTFLSTSEGTYSITYTLAASGGCATVTQTTGLTITKLPVATIEYTATPYCKTASNPTPTNSGSGGTFTSTTGLVFISTSTGEVNLSSSTAGSYTVSYVIPAASGCATVTATTPITITAAPIAPEISYITPVCASAGTATVTQTGGTSGGVYTITPMPVGVSINGSTGMVTFLSTNDGTYSVTYTITASGGCATVTTSTALVISPRPTATAGGNTSICATSPNNSVTVSGASVTNSTSFIWTKSSNASGVLLNEGTLTPTYTAVAADADKTITLLLTATGSSSGCGTTTATATYTIYVVGSTEITRNPVSQTVCTYGTTSFSVTVAPTLPAPTYQWYKKSPTDTAFILIPVGGVYSGTTTSILTITGAPYSLNQYEYEVFVQGCSYPKVSLPAVLTVIPLPTAAAGGTQTICTNATATVSGATATNYSAIAWTESGAGSITSGATTLTPTYSAAAGDAGTTVTLTMTVTGFGACAGVATATATYSVVVNALPTAAAGGTTTICSNSTATVSGAASSGGTILWTENGAGSITSGATTLTPVYTAAVGDAGHVVTLLMTVTNTCTTPQTATATYTVNVTGLPTATAGGSTTVCAIGTVVTVSGASATNYSSILWTENGAGSLTNAGTLTPTYTPVSADGGNTVTLLMTVTGNGGCSAATATATYTVNVTATPTATAGGSATICADGFATVYGASATNYSSILWTKGTGLGTLTNAGTFTPTYTAAAADAGTTVTLTMTVTGSGACGARTATATFTVTVRTIPTATITPTGATTFCAGGSVLLTASTGSSYLWSNALTTQAITATSTGSYTVTVYQTISSLTCSNTSTPTTVTARPLPVSSISGENAVCVGNTTLLTSAGTWVTATWQSLTPSVATISSGGVVTGVSVGTSTITLTVFDGYCSNTFYKLMTVSNVPSVTLTSGTGSNAQAFCLGYALSPAITYNVGGSATGAGVTGLPAGVSGIFSGATFTISGTPTVDGTFNYTVTTTGGCTPAATATGTITVHPLPSSVISGASSVCVGSTTPLTATGTWYSATWTSITPAIATISVAGVVTGVSAGTTTITLTVYNGTCYNTFYYPMRVDALGSLTLTSATGTNAQTSCINVAITGITYAVGGSATGAGVTGLPAGVSGTFTGTTFTISGTPTASGTFNYTVTTTGGSCTAATATGTITVTALPTVTLTSGSASQTVCQNVAITPVVYTVGSGATSAGVTGLPTGVSGTFTGTTLTIAGTPSVSGAFVYMVTTTGGCSPAATASGTITVTTLPTIALTSGTGSNVQTRCAGVAISNITYTVGGSATSAGVSGLPAGVSGTFSGATFTISGTPSAAGAYTFTVTTTGGCSPAATATGTITVNALPTIVLATGSTSQTVCKNVAITTIGFTVGGAATGAGVSGLPTGVSGTFSGTTLTIAGTPSVSGTFPYIVTTTGGSCTAATATGTITVNVLPTVVLSSASGTNNQTVIVNNDITNITYTVGGVATGAVVTGLPAGVAGTFTGTTVTISGTPTATGTFVYTVTTEGGSCGSATATGTITVNPVTGTVGGYVTYLNSHLTGMNGITVRLRNSTGIVATTATGFDSGGNKGYYLFTGIAAGTYTVTAEYTGAWLGNNSTDALIVNLNTIGQWTLTGLYATVADVNADGLITGLDALMIKDRTIGYITSYPAGDWKFTSAVVVLVTNATADLNGLCVGDVNGSNTPTFKSVSYLNAVEDVLMTIPVNKTFTYTIKSDVMADLGAMTLFMNYDPTLFSIDKVNSNIEGLRFRIGDGVVALAWSNTKPLTVNADEVILSLNITAKDVVPQATQIFTINSGSEFADPSARRIDDFNLKMSNVTTANGIYEFSMVNYPNPFRNSTEIVYTIPEAGKVKLVLTNMFGQQIRTLVDQAQEAGMYKVQVNSADGYLKPGLYLYSIEVEGANATYTKTNKMLYTR
jgi:hypothetical protein